jgi:NitT/TauT family transport system substrate-binding protein
MRDAFYLSLNKVDYREKGLECQAGKDLPNADCGFGEVFSTLPTIQKKLYISILNQKSRRTIRDCPDSAVKSEAVSMIRRDKKQKLRIPLPMIHDKKMKISRQSLKRLGLLSIVIVGVLAIVLGSLFYLDSRKTYQGNPASLTIGTPALETNALIYIAGDRGYFERNGLKVTIKEYDSGGAAVSGLMRNEIDLAIASEFVMVNNILQRREIRTFGSIDRFEDMFVIARKDWGIGKVADLKNRTIGVPLGTIAAFYLGRYLTLHGLSPADVKILDVRPDRSADALAAGDVDAVVTWHPHLDRIMDRYGGWVIVWPIQSSQLTYWNIIGRADWMGAHRETIDRFLRSISQAEEYASLHPEEAKALVKKRLGYDDTYIAKVWRDNLFSLSLDQALVAAMEDETRWMIKNNLTPEKQIPDFLNYIYLDGLKKIKPEALNIIR